MNFVDCDKNTMKKIYANIFVGKIENKVLR